MHNSVAQFTDTWASIPAGQKAIAAAIFAVIFFAFAIEDRGGQNLRTVLCGFLALVLLAYAAVLGIGVLTYKPPLEQGQSRRTFQLLGMFGAAGLQLDVVLKPHLRDQAKLGLDEVDVRFLFLGDRGKQVARDEIARGLAVGDRVA